MQSPLVGIPDDGGDDDDQQKRTDDGPPHTHPAASDALEGQTEDAMTRAALQCREKRDLDQREDGEDRQRIPREKPRDEVGRAVIDEEGTDPTAEAPDRPRTRLGHAEPLAGITLRI